MATLDDVRNHFFLKAERRWHLVLALSVATVVFAIASVSSGTPIWVGFTAVAALILPVVIAWTRESANTHQIRGDKCRRLMLIADGLGKPISAAEMAEIRAWSAGAEINAAPFTPPFYSSKYPPGARRLADITTESAFFTEHLTSKMVVGLLGLVSFLLLAVVVALYLADLTAGSVAGWTLVSRSIAVLLAFLISGDLALLAKKYSDLRAEAHDVFARCGELRNSGQATTDEVRNVVESYSVALVQCPPIPNWLYLRYRDALNAIYRESHSL